MVSDTNPNDAVTYDANWRPTMTSILVGVAVTLVFVSVLATLSEHWVAEIASILGGVGITLVLLLVAVERYSVPARVLASLLVLPAGALLFTALALPFRTSLSPIEFHVTVVGLGVATAGAVASPYDLFSDRNLKTTIAFVVALLIIPAIALGVMFILRTEGIAQDGGELWRDLVGVLLATGASTGSGYFSTMLAAALAALSISTLIEMLSVLPLVEIAPRNRRERRREHVASAVSALRTVRLMILAWLFVSVILIVPEIHSQVETAVPIVTQFILSLGTATSLRVLLLGVLSIATGTIVVIQGTAYLGRLEEEILLTWVAPQVGGLTMTVAVFQFTPEVVRFALAGESYYYDLLAQLPASGKAPFSIVLVIAIGTCILPLSLYVLLRVLKYLLLPDRATGAAIASFGLFMAAVGSMLRGDIPLISFITVAGSFFVWDIGSHAAEIGDELGRHAPTRHVELAHVGGSFLIASLGVGFAVIALVIARRVATPSASMAPLTLFASLAGVLLFALGLNIR